ncbi:MULTISPECIES: hypothetical protein [unclassified Pseudomonas]|uniref:hypothetical protein n=1 Tax=unclassified Pseudomonas TaxID=196821 RepID=UPI002579B913|nr:MULTISPECIES: hypothetical protein [unclassified Pseudomonas]
MTNNTHQLKFHSGLICCMVTLPLAFYGAEAVGVERIIDRDTVIDASDPLVSYQVVLGATLTGNGATTQHIFLREGAGLELNGSSVISAADGVLLEGGPRPTSTAAPSSAKTVALQLPAAVLAARKHG